MDLHTTVVVMSPEWFTLTAHSHTYRDIKIIREKYLNGQCPQGLLHNHGEEDITML